jgi:hypothetical protein
MGLRRLDNVERKATRAMAGAKLYGGEHKDDVTRAVANYLQARGWLPGPALKRAGEVVRRAGVEKGGAHHLTP